MTINCIVLIHLYSASCSAHQSESLPVKRVVLREWKEAPGSPVNKVDRVEGGSWLSSWDLSLPYEIRFLPRDLSSSFYKLLKTFIFARAWAGSASE